MAITVVRDPDCTCCEKWVAHLQQAGFQTTLTESAKRRDETPGMPEAARSCHTGTVGGYLIEGHVPAADIKRLLRERPAIVGLAVPGMPTGSPGMESSTGKITPYDVLAVDKNGKTRVFASHR
jgi:hypothetical protein